MQRTERRQSAQCLGRRPSASLAEAGAVAEVRPEDGHAWADTYRTVTQQFSTQLCVYGCTRYTVADGFPADGRSGGVLWCE